MTKARREYRLALPASPAVARGGACVGLKLRPPALESAPALGGLLLDAYLGTYDYDGEDLDQAIAAARSYFAGQHGRAMPECSAVAWRGPLPVAACLVAWLEPRACPFVAFVSTRADQKRAGAGRLVLAHAVRRTGREGHGELRAFITEGNGPSQALFRSVGFEDLGRPGPQGPRRAPTARGAP